MIIGDKKLKEPTNLEDVREIYNSLGLKFNEHSPEWLNQFYNAKKLVEMNNSIFELIKTFNKSIKDTSDILKTLIEEEINETKS